MVGELNTKQQYLYNSCKSTLFLVVIEWQVSCDNKNKQKFKDEWKY